MNMNNIIIIFMFNLQLKLRCDLNMNKGDGLFKKTDYLLLEINNDSLFIINLV